MIQFSDIWPYGKQHVSRQFQQNPFNTDQKRNENTNGIEITIMLFSLRDQNLLGEKGNPRKVLAVDENKVKTVA